MNEPHELRERARRWLRWAEEDLRAARVLFAADDVVPRGACGCAQQAAEKALKALLVDADIDPPKSHDLARLARMSPAIVHRLDTGSLDDLSRWSIEGRYPADLAEASLADARAAVALAATLVELSATLLGNEPGQP